MSTAVKTQVPPKPRVPPVVFAIGFQVVCAVFGVIIHYTKLEVLARGFVPHAPQLFLFAIPVALGAAVLQWLAFNVNWARAEYNVAWPTLYADKATCKEAEAYNCYQRAHQHTLEGWAQLFAELYVANQLFPVLSCIFASGFILSRIPFAWGYYSGNVANRRGGNFGYVLS